MTHPDPPTRAEVDAAEAAVEAGHDIHAGMVACRFRCGAWFHWPESDAAVRHMRIAHGEES